MRKEWMNFLGNLRNFDMKAPDKIFLQACGSCPLEGDECKVCKFEELEEITWDTEMVFKKDVAYIRKDALIEWAKQKQYESTTIVADNFWQEVIDKINEI